MIRSWLVLMLGLAAWTALPAEEISCASAESMDGLMSAWTMGFTAGHPARPAKVTRKARYSADFIEPLARGEIEVAPFARELFSSERERFAAVAGAEPRLLPVALGSRSTKGGTHAIFIFVHESNPLTRKIYLASAPHPGPGAEDFIRYVLSAAGQSAIGHDPPGFFPLPGDPPLSPPVGAGYLTKDGAITLIGYNDMAEMIGEFDRMFAAEHPGFRFAPVLQGTKTAVAALIKQESALAPMGAEFSPAELASYRAAFGRDPLVFRVAHASLNPRALSGPLAIIVRNDTPRASISFAELAQIFSGRELHGLRPCGLHADTALGRFFRQQVMPQEEFAPAFDGFAQSAMVVAHVAQDPQAVGFTAAMRADARVKILPVSFRAGGPPVALTPENLQAQRYPLDRHLLIVARAPLEPWMAEYLRLVLAPAGQEAVVRGTLGYLPLGAAELAAERDKLEAAARAR